MKSHQIFLKNLVTLGIDPNRSLLNVRIVFNFLVFVSSIISTYIYFLDVTNDAKEWIFTIYCISTVSSTAVIFAAILMGMDNICKFIDSVDAIFEDSETNKNLKLPKLCNLIIYLFWLQDPNIENWSEFTRQTFSWKKNGAAPWSFGWSKCHHHVLWHPKWYSAFSITMPRKLDVMHFVCHYRLGKILFEFHDISNMFS